MTAVGPAIPDLWNGTSAILTDAYTTSDGTRYHLRLTPLNGSRLHQVHRADEIKKLAAAIFSAIRDDERSAGVAPDEISATFYADRGATVTLKGVEHSDLPDLPLLSRDRDDFAARLPLRSFTAPGVNGSPIDVKTALLGIIRLLNDVGTQELPVPQAPLPPAPDATRDDRDDDVSDTTSEATTVAREPLIPAPQQTPRNLFERIRQARSHARMQTSERIKNSLLSEEEQKQLKADILACRKNVLEHLLAIYKADKCYAKVEEGMDDLCICAGIDGPSAAEYSLAKFNISSQADMDKLAADAQ